MTRDFVIGSLGFILLGIAPGPATAQTGAVAGREFSSAVTSQEQNLRLVGRIFVSDNVVRVRAVIVTIRWGNGPDFYTDANVRRLAESIGATLLLTEFQTIADAKNNRPRRADQGGAEALLQLLRQVARDTNRREIEDAPLVFWGHSAAGPFGAGFAALHPDRTIAFVRYHSGPMAGGEVPAMTRVPALFLSGGRDTSTGAPGGWTNLAVDGPKALWQFGRSGGGPWTFAYDPEADHDSIEALTRSNALMIAWISAVVRQRIRDEGSRLFDIAPGSGWLGNNDTGEVIAVNAFSGSMTNHSWLPDETTAQFWRALMGHNSGRQ